MVERAREVGPLEGNGPRRRHLLGTIKTHSRCNRARFSRKGSHRPVRANPTRTVSRVAVCEERRQATFHPVDAVVETVDHCHSMSRVNGGRTSGRGHTGMYTYPPIARFHASCCRVNGGKDRPGKKSRTRKNASSLFLPWSVTRRNKVHLKRTQGYVRGSPIRYGV